MKRITLVGAMMDDNLGEEVYPECLKTLLLEEYKKKGSNEDIYFDMLDIYGRKQKTDRNAGFNPSDDYFYGQKVGRVTAYICGFLQNISWVLKRKQQYPTLHGLLTDLEWNVNPNKKHRLKTYYTDMIQNSDLLVVSGGGIVECTFNHDYYHHVDLVTSVAEQYHVPVVLNAVGMNYQNGYSFGWRIMKRALNRKCVKYISCRDGCDWINQHIYDGSQKAVQLPCAAIIADKLIEIPEMRLADTVGICAVRGNILSSYGYPFSESDLLQIYANTIRQLSKRKIRCAIFTTGAKIDYSFAEKLFQIVEHDNVTLLPRPTSSLELIHMIAGFRAIITGRLHSCIIAYALKIPAIAIAWSNKFVDFFHLIGKSNSAIRPSQLSADTIISAFDDENAKGYDYALQEDLRKKIRCTIKEYLELM